ncbi:MAG: pyridoxamine 5'-phosphate oxidase [Akkermansiaceae bacterium]|nr:pyridoxamine 5'-phosphate oxidase [Akkermansiaceae bacterium]
MSDPHLILAELRESYTRAGLRKADLDADPIVQFRSWLDEAIGAGLVEPNAMTLATADAAGRPSARTVLLKGLDERGFCFFTNYGSRKGQDLAVNSRAALVFLWKDLERQVTVRGDVTTTSEEESRAYFHSRPYGSQIGAWVSEKQSTEIPGREYLEERDRMLLERFPEGEEVPLPPFWGGFRLAPDRIEFWQGRPDRLHDRLAYTRHEGAWRIARLSP